MPARNGQVTEDVAALRPYRILDLTEYGGLIGPRTLADFGADVIKIEPPGGSPSRIGPYYKDTVDREKSLFWFCYCLNKRGITLNLETEAGRKIFKRLAGTCDAVIESFPAGYLPSLGLGYEDLTGIKPDIIMTSVSWFGQTGPKARYLGCDLTSWASGGCLYICGDADRPPVWISFPQAQLFGGMDAANATISALYYREMHGKGQYIDLSLQECAVSPTLRTTVFWAINHYELKRSGLALIEPTRGIRFATSLPCKNGNVIIYIMGATAPFTTSMQNLVAWMDEEGAAPDWLRKIDWVTDYDASRVSQAFIDRVESAVAQFLMKKTKSQLFEEGIKRRILVAPMQNSQEVAEDPQLQYRDFWMKVEHPELNDEVTYVGPSIGLSETPIRVYRRAPLIGEHNKEIYGEIGLTGPEMTKYREEGTI
jgi:crotonobetainyl-CoA:carnitine CoA-transferase CaiB-like acyl-CoA transferase